MLEKIKEKRGGSTVLEMIIGMALITFMLFYPIATFSLTHKENLLEDVFATSIQMMSIEGGLTDRVEDIIFLNLEAKSLIPPNSHDNAEIREKVEIVSNADAREGATQNLIYRDDADPKIYLEIWYPADNEVKLINGLSKVIGASDGRVPFKNDGKRVTWYYKPRGYILSEKVDY